MRDITIAITAASYSGNKGAAAMLQSSIRQLQERYGEALNINLMSVYPSEDRKQCPWDFVKIVSCKPEQLLFMAFPLAILYRLFSWCPPVKKLLLKNKILKAYASTDLVIDEAGISFVDSRGFVMNTYAFVCMAVPLLMGVPAVKYAQAMGTFHNPWNRFLAKWILPKLKLICARGKGTGENLNSIGVKKNVKRCADGAFSMEDDAAAAEKVRERCEADPFYQKDIVGLSLSSVVNGKCEKQGIDYKQCMARFADALAQEGYGVLFIANAARLGKTKPRNNDLVVCDEIYGMTSRKEDIRWYHEEMDAEEIREYIARCRFLVASRFHAMVGALEKEVPVLLIGWSHKYQEVLDDFELGSYATDYSGLQLDSLMESFHAFVQDEDSIRSSLHTHHDQVMESSRDNIRFISEVVDEQTAASAKKRRKEMLRFYEPEHYTGPYLALRKGYASDEAVRENASSGGMITALLEHMLEEHIIDGAWVTKAGFEGGKLCCRPFIATTKEELRSASSSVYTNVPFLKYVEDLRAFDGKVAVVLVPCQMRAFANLLKKDRELADKVVLKLGLFCSGNPNDVVTQFCLDKAGISTEKAKRLYYRQGHWHGESVVLFEDGSRKTFSYTRSFCTLKNAYFFYRSGCMFCQDHYAFDADISFGDLWIGEMKKNPIKHTCCVIRSERALQIYKSAVSAGRITDSHVSGRDMIRGQKRALAFKYSCAKAKQKDTSKKLDTEDPCRLNHRLAYALARFDQRFSEEHPELLKKIPGGLLYYYMCFIRVLLSF